MNKKKMVILSFFSLILLLFVIILYSNKYKKQVYTGEENNQIRTGTKISMMLETKRGSGDYALSTSSKWPTEGYIFNSERSKCENGGTLSWNDETKSVVFKIKGSDKCYIYFDREPGDITIAANNVPTTYGKLGAITCSNSDATYNQRYNRIEVSNINTKYENCTLNYTDSSSKVNLATYITGLEGTTQGTGQVVNETANIPDYSSAVAISESSYTSQSVWTGTSSSPTSETTISGVYTFANNTWTSVPSAMTSGTYYNFKFTPSENGYYQLCYDLSAGSYSNQISASVNTRVKYFGTSTSLETTPYVVSNGCTNLGYVTTSDYIRIMQRAFLDIPTFSFSIKKVSNVQENVDAGIRYEGKNPNNYVWFNNEYWRIVGVFDSNSHGQSGKNLVKIIRADVLDVLELDKLNVNDWASVDLNKLLNGAYYNAQDGTSSGNCHGDRDITGNCDYTKKGIQSGYREMIAKVTWYLGGNSSIGETAEDFYGYERGTTVYSGKPTSTTGYIGLMYPSDYGYSVLSSSCARTTNLSSYDSSTCAGASWLSGKENEWTLSPNSGDSYRAFSLFNANLNITYPTIGYGVRPVLYLDTSVNKIDGEGSLENPYILGM